MRDSRIKRPSWYFEVRRALTVLAMLAWLLCGPPEEMAVGTEDDWWEPEPEADEAPAL